MSLFDFCLKGDNATFNNACLAANGNIDRSTKDASRPIPKLQGRLEIVATVNGVNIMRHCGHTEDAYYFEDAT